MALGGKSETISAELVELELGEVTGSFSWVAFEVEISKMHHTTLLLHERATDSSDDSLNGANAFTNHNNYNLPDNIQKYF